MYKFYFLVPHSSGPCMLLSGNKLTNLTYAVTTSALFSSNVMLASYSCASSLVFFHIAASTIPSCKTKNKQKTVRVNFLGTRHNVTVMTATYLENIINIIMIIYLFIYCHHHQSIINILTRIRVTLYENSVMRV